MNSFADIRPFNDSEVSEVLTHVKDNATMLELLSFAFPELTPQERLEKLLSCRKIFDFQSEIMYPVIQHAMERSVRGFTYEGFENLNPKQAYLFISNHRDIILDTSFLNFVLHKLKFKMTASAIGDNLVRKPFLLAFAKLNRNFIIHRGLPAREMLEKSKIVSSFISRSILQKKRSVWIAQREGRTKNGDDRTQQGVIKMLSMNCPKEQPLMQYFKELQIVPMAISYELDPTDMLKMPAIMAQHNGVEYVKSEDEDFKNIVQGFLGQKGRVHISVSAPLSQELGEIQQENSHVNKQIQQVVHLLDQKIHTQYKLWPTNFIAYDMLHHTEKFKDQYSAEEKNIFVKRMNLRSESSDPVFWEKYLQMYANPVSNKYI